VAWFAGGLQTPHSCDMIKSVVPGLRTWAFALEGKGHKRSNRVGCAIKSNYLAECAEDG